MLGLLCCLRKTELYWCSHNCFFFFQEKPFPPLFKIVIKRYQNLANQFFNSDAGMQQIYELSGRNQVVEREVSRWDHQRTTHCSRETPFTNAPRGDQDEGHLCMLANCHQINKVRVPAAYTQHVWDMGCEILSYPQPSSDGAAIN